MRQKIRSHAAPIAAAVALSLSSISAWAVNFNQTNLVTDDQSANPAQITDQSLKNAWGMSFSSTSPFWVSANGSGNAFLYKVDPATQTTTKQALSVSIPGDGSVTGQAFNGTASFNGNRFLFVSEDGTVSGWRPSLGTTGTVPADPIAALATAVYKGTTVGNVSGNDYLYAANFRTGTVDAFKGNVSAPSLSGTFTDPDLPKGYAPFNVQNLNGSLYVTYALQDADKKDDVKGAGHGFVDQFTLSGDFVGRVASGGTLDSPWGLAIAPSSFGSMAGDLLVGNFGDGHINIFDPTTHAFLGQVLDANKHPVAVDGLWAISPGNDGSAGSSHLLYFTAGPSDETHGLFGVLAPVPEPSEYVMMLAGLGIVLLLARRQNPLLNG